MPEVVTFGEAMIRLSPPHFQRLEQTATLDVQVGGGELNVAVGVARLGLTSSWVSRLPQNSLGRLTENRARQAGVDTSHIVWSTDAENRMGLYFLEFGAAPRASAVLYDRRNSAISAIRPGEVDWKHVMGGARWFHVSGITPALSDSAAAVTQEALQAAKQAGLTVEKAIAVYESQLAANGLKERSVATTCYRLRKFFGPVSSVPVASLTPTQARGLYAAFTGSVDSRLNALAEAKTFSARAKANGWTDALLLADVHGEGRRKYGKTKLSLDESRKFLAACLQLAASDDLQRQTAGVASAIALVFGLRASEITGLQVRDLDAGGTIIRINKAKTRAGIRALQVPEWFRPYLQRLAENKVPTDPLVGRERTWLHRTVRSICRMAGVTEVPPHGLRGTHADLALTAAATPKAVSQALGHESLTTTYRHYADEGITQQHEHQRVVESLAPPPSIRPA